MIYKVTVEFSKEFLDIEKNQIKIGVRTKPIKGEANKEIIRKIAKHFKISTSLVQIKSGHKSSEKIIEILEQII
ncbi:MAG: DUF167 domain-containing protein [Candidatus Nitrosopumilus sp. bin_6a]